VLDANLCPSKKKPSPTSRGKRGNSSTISVYGFAHFFAAWQCIFNGADRPGTISQFFIDSCNEASRCISQGLPGGCRTIGRHAFVKMCNTIGTVAVTEYESMTDR